MWRHTSKLARIHVGVPARARVRKSTASFVSWSSCHSRMLAQQAACSRWSAAFSCGVFFFLDLTAAGCRLDANNAKMCLAQMPDMMCIMSGKISHTKSNMGMSARGDACLIPVFLYGRSLIKTPFLRASGRRSLASWTSLARPQRTNSSCVRGGGGGSTMRAPHAELAFRIKCASGRYCLYPSQTLLLTSGAAEDFLVHQWQHLL